MTARIPEGERPCLSVVIASHNAAAVIADCLAALHPQAQREHAEIIVADSSTDGTADLVRARFPDVRLLRFSAPFTIPRLRGEAIAAARGEIVAILDPYCVVADGWMSQLLLQARGADRVIGGAVELDPSCATTLLRWATYLCEYAAFMPPLPEGPSDELTGNNIAYPRSVLGESADLAHTGFWKAFANWRLRKAGHQLWNASSLVVRLNKPIPFAEFLRSRYHHGRCFAAMRVAGAVRTERWSRVLTVPLLPGLALWRQARSFWPKQRRRATFVLASPLLLLLHSTWAWGELWGYLRGPGRSCAQLYF